ncbi:hypothetical protein L210DRAFT_3509227 [Boletus edulis BED1]|uniref:Uncharacterized protein n=1 Tax=Boletus edulis BED1 TaxID=1328754 RepID=A0AAD4G7L3_BOLED|nr:hypothetical protein L210DRAFT_3509227 [Boletus edulis BED1]
MTTSRLLCSSTSATNFLHSNKAQAADSGCPANSIAVVESASSLTTSAIVYGKVGEQPAQSTLPNIIDSFLGKEALSATQNGTAKACCDDNQPTEGRWFQQRAFARGGWRGLVLLAQGPTIRVPSRMAETRKLVDDVVREVAIDNPAESNKSSPPLLWVALTRAIKAAPVILESSPVVIFKERKGEGTKDDGTPTIFSSLRQRLQGRPSFRLHLSVKHDGAVDQVPVLSDQCALIFSYTYPPSPRLLDTFARLTQERRHYAACSEMNHGRLLAPSHEHSEMLYADVASTSRRIPPLWGFLVGKRFKILAQADCGPNSSFSFALHQYTAVYLGRFDLHRGLTKFPKTIGDFFNTAALCAPVRVVAIGMRSLASKMGTSIGLFRMDTYGNEGLPASIVLKYFRTPFLCLQSGPGEPEPSSTNSKGKGKLNERAYSFRRTTLPTEPLSEDELVFLSGITGLLFHECARLRLSRFPLTCGPIFFHKEGSLRNHRSRRGEATEELKTEGSAAEDVGRFVFYPVAVYGYECLGISSTAGSIRGKWKGGILCLGSRRQGKATGVENGGLSGLFVAPCSPAVRVEDGFRDLKMLGAGNADKLQEDWFTLSAAQGAGVRVRSVRNPRLRTKSVRFSYQGQERRCSWQSAALHAADLKGLVTPLSSTVPNAFWSEHPPSAQLQDAFFRVAQNKKPKPHNFAVCCKTLSGLATPSVQQNPCVGPDRRP